MGIGEVGAGGAISDETRRAILEHQVRENTREFRATVRSRGDFDAVLCRVTAPPDHRRQLVVELLLVLLAVVYFAAGQWPSSSVVAEVVAVGLPVGYGLVWLFLTATAGEELESLSVDERGRIVSARSGRAIETRSNALRVGIPLILAAAGGLIALLLVHDILYPPAPACSAPVARDTDLCVILPSFLGSQTGGFTVAEYRGLLLNLRWLGLIFSALLALPSLWFLRRMLTGRRVLDVRPIDRRVGDPEAGTSFPGVDGVAYAALMAGLSIILIWRFAGPLVMGGEPVTATASPGAGVGICAIFGSPSECKDGGIAQVTIGGVMTTLSPGACFDDKNGLIDARYGDMKNFVGDHVFVNVGRDASYLPYGTGLVGGKQFVLGEDATGSIADNGIGTVVATDSLNGYGTIRITFSCG